MKMIETGMMPKPNGAPFVCSVRLDRKGYMCPREAAAFLTMESWQRIDKLKNSLSPKSLFPYYEGRMVCATHLAELAVWYKCIG